MKLFLYCTKDKNTHLIRNESDNYWYVMNNHDLSVFKNVETYNGKIVAECDFEVVKNEDLVFDCCFNKETELTLQQMAEYTGVNDYYAIHIKNLKERVMELSVCYKEEKIRNSLYSSFIIKKPITKAPQNMMRVWVYENGKWVMYILISVRPEWVCLELNGIKNVEVRKKVLKEMQL